MEMQFNRRVAENKAEKFSKKGGEDMAYLYFNAEWLAQIKNTKHPPALGDMLMSIYLITRDLDCQLVMKPFAEWIVRDDGCTLIPFILRVPSEAILQKCVEELKPLMEFTNLRPAHEQDFKGDPHMFAMRAGLTDYLLTIIEKY